MLTSFEIPDPFTEFRIAKYEKQRGGMRYDFFIGEWDAECLACGEPLNAPNKKTMIKIRLFDTRNECLGGY